MLWLGRAAARGTKHPVRCGEPWEAGLAEHACAPDIADHKQIQTSPHLGWLDDGSQEQGGQAISKGPPTTQQGGTLQLALLLPQLLQVARQPAPITTFVSHVPPVFGGQLVYEEPEHTGAWERTGSHRALLPMVGITGPANQPDSLTMPALSPPVPTHDCPAAGDSTPECPDARWVQGARGICCAACTRRILSRCDQHLLPFRATMTPAADTQPSAKGHGPGTI